MISRIVHLEGGIGWAALVTLLAMVFTARKVLRLNVTNAGALIRGHEATVSAGKLTGSRLDNFAINIFSGCFS